METNATIQPPPPAAAQSENIQAWRDAASVFPTDLPDRPAQRRPRYSGVRGLLTFQFLRSYSLRGITEKRTRWRRIAMICTLVFTFLSAVASLLFLAFYSVAILIVLCILDALFWWLLGWAMAVNSDAVGTRRALGITWGRKVLDVVIYSTLFLYMLFFVLLFFAIGGFGYQGAWLGLSLLNVGVAWIASEPPYQA